MKFALKHPKRLQLLSSCIETEDSMQLYELIKKKAANPALSQTEEQKISQDITRLKSEILNRNSHLADRPDGAFGIVAKALMALIDCLCDSFKSYDVLERSSSARTIKEIRTSLYNPLEDNTGVEVRPGLYKSY